MTCTGIRSTRWFSNRDDGSKIGFQGLWGDMAIKKGVINQKDIFGYKIARKF
jgi:hypothetical protein